MLLGMFASMFATGSPLTIFRLLYRSVVPEYFITEQEVQTSDGKYVTVYCKKFWYTNTYSYTLTTDEYPAWNYKNSKIPVDDQTFPIAFDVVNSTPWIVLPMRGKKCKEYGFPIEGLVFFTLEGNSWKQVPYKKAPVNLRVNLLQNESEYKAKITPEIRQHLDAEYYRSERTLQYISADGSGKTIKAIAESNMELPHIANTSSCYYLNPPVDPDEKRSLREYVGMEPVQVQVNLMKVGNGQIELSANDKNRMFPNYKNRGNCDKVVKRHYVAQLSEENQAEFSQIAGVPEGPFKSSGTAVRVELYSSTGAGTKSFYLPIRGFSFARIGLMDCQPDRVVVYFGSDTNSQQILEYSLEARLLKRWLVQSPGKAGN